MAGDEDAFIYDEASGEWISPDTAKASVGNSVEVRDAVGNLPVSGKDQCVC